MPESEVYSVECCVYECFSYSCLVRRQNHTKYLWLHCGFWFCCFSTGNHYCGLKATARTVLSGYPQPLTSFGLTSSLKRVDAAVYVQSTGKTFLCGQNILEVSSR